MSVSLRHVWAEEVHFINITGGLSADWVCPVIRIIESDQSTIADTSTNPPSGQRANKDFEIRLKAPKSSKWTFIQDYFVKMSFFMKAYKTNNDKPDLSFDIMQNGVKSQHASTDAKTLSADLKLSILDHLHVLLTFEAAFSSPLEKHTSDKNKVTHIPKMRGSKVSYRTEPLTDEDEETKYRVLPRSTGNRRALAFWAFSSATCFSCVCLHQVN